MTKEERVLLIAVAQSLYTILSAIPARESVYTRVALYEALQDIGGERPSKKRGEERE